MLAQEALDVVRQLVNHHLKGGQADGREATLSAGAVVTRRRQWCADADLSALCLGQLGELTLEGLEAFVGQAFGALQLQLWRPGHIQILMLLTWFRTARHIRHV